MTKPYRESLEALHRRLEEARRDGSDPDLHALHDETKGSLERSGDTDPNIDTGFRGRLEAAIDRYGASHPDLTRAAQSFLDVLSANGL